jgi:hypothetical protein
VSPLAAGCSCSTPLDPDRLAPDCPVHGLVARLTKVIPEPDNHHNAWLCPYCTPKRRADLAEAWERGRVSGHSNAMRQMSDEPDAPNTANPYLDAGANQP